jgi:hypothetical protein
MRLILKSWLLGFNSATKRMSPLGDLGVKQTIQLIKIETVSESSR